MSAARWWGLPVCATDGTISVPDIAANLAVYLVQQTGSHGGSGYPLIRLGGGL
ncbi:MAG TPA: hypothetical protein VHJ83_01455 [Micromonosporaceae bacterium]|nr:hypothetical protein [Micromonosporaceae bacterium]